MPPRRRRTSAAWTACAHQNGYGEQLEVGVGVGATSRGYGCGGGGGDVDDDRHYDDNGVNKNVCGDDDDGGDRNGSALSMCYLCVIHVLCMCYPCVICVLSMCYLCVTNVLFHVLSMCHPCVIHVSSMCFPCVIHSPVDPPLTQSQLTQSSRLNHLLVDLTKTHP